jgi:hypothetical protein
MSDFRTKDSLKEYMVPIILTVVVLALSFFLHTKWCGSEMRQSEEIWQKRLDLHVSYYPFSIRYFTTYPALFLKNTFSIPPRESFFIIQFLLALILGPLFYRYLRILSFDRKWANIGLFLLLSAYPILGAHLEPVYTWDDFWVYIFLILTFSALLKGRLLSGAIFLTISSFAREQSLIFWPIFVLSAFWYCREYKPWKRIVYLMLPLIIYLPFYFIMWEPFPRRAEYIIFNFENYLRGSDSIFSFLISFGFLWLTSALALRQLTKMKDNWPHSRFLFWGAVLSVLPTVALTFFFTKARETRIFFPPFIFLIPLSVIFLRSAYEYFKAVMTKTGKSMLLISLPILLATGIIVAPMIFPVFEFRNCPRFNQQALGVHLGFMITIGVFYLIKLFGRKRDETDGARLE